MKQASLTILIFANVMLFCVEIAVSRPPAEVNNAVTIDAADPRIPLATCSLLCKHVYGVRREYAEDSRGIFHPVYECVDQQIIQFQARSDNCRSCLKGCSKFKHFVEAEQKLEESVLATKPSLHCYTWTMPEQVTIGDSVDKDGGLVPAMYIKWDVILKNLSGVLGGGKISNRMPAVAFLVDGRMVPSPFDKDSGEPREWMPLYETINSVSCLVIFVTATSFPIF